MGRSGQQSQNANYLYSLVGVVGIVAFVAIFVIIRTQSGPAVPSVSNALTGNAIADVTPPPNPAIEGTLGFGETKTYTYNGIDYEITNVFISDDFRVKFSVNGEVPLALRKGESASLSGGMKITLLGVQRSIPAGCNPEMPGSCSAEKSEATFRFENGGGQYTPWYPGYAIIPDSLAFSGMKTYTFEGQDYEMRFGGVTYAGTNSMSAAYPATATITITDGRHLSQPVIGNNLVEGNGFLFGSRYYLYVKELLANKNRADAAVTFFVYDRRYAPECVGTGSTVWNVNDRGEAMSMVCCDGELKIPPVCGRTIPPPPRPMPPTTGAPTTNDASGTTGTSTDTITVDAYPIDPMPTAPLRCGNYELYCEAGQLRSRAVQTLFVPDFCRTENGFLCTEFSASTDIVQLSLHNNLGFTAYNVTFNFSGECGGSGGVFAPIDDGGSIGISSQCDDTNGDGRFIAPFIVSYAKTSNGPKQTTVGQVSIRVHPTCSFNGATYRQGDSFPAGDGCNTCSCGPKGVICTKIACPIPTKCESDGDCKDGQVCVPDPCVAQPPQGGAAVDPSISPPNPAQCGGHCVSDVCDYNGQIIPVGGSIPSGDGCNTCSCGPNGRVMCTMRACPIPTVCATDADCDAGQMCVSPPCVDGADCPSHCVPRTCSYNGMTVAVGSSIPSSDGCNSCSCRSDGSVICTQMACPQPPSSSTGGSQ